MYPNVNPNSEMCVSKLRTLAKLLYSKTYVFLPRISGFLKSDRLRIMAT
jgi:hypothetical protein